MEQEIEIEFKNILTQEEFHRCLDHFSLTKDQLIKQVNYYFDTPDFQLKALGSALRIREKQGNFKLTLKQPMEEGLLESSEILDSSEALPIINNNAPITGKVAEILAENSISTDKLENLGALTTYRVEKKTANGLIVFDHSVYLGTEDFEIEFEVNNLNAGKKAFNEILSLLQIPQRETKNKILRFFLKKGCSKGHC